MSSKKILSIASPINRSTKLMSELDAIIESNKDDILPLNPISLDGLLKKLSKHRPDIKSKVKKKIQCTRHADTSQRTKKKEKQAYLISTKELEKAAKKDKDKQYELGMRYDEEAKYSKAYASFDKAAKQGHATQSKVKQSKPTQCK